MTNTTRPGVTARHHSSRRAVSPVAKSSEAVSAIRPNVDTRRAAELIGMSSRTLEKWRGEGTGPPFLKLGRRVLYSLTDLEAWIRSRRRQSTSEG